MAVVFHFMDSTLAATTTMGMGLCDLIWRVASSPCIPGNRISIAMTSGEFSARLPSASSALAAIAHTSRRGSRPMLYSSSARTTAESSMIITRVFFMSLGRSYHLPDCLQQFRLIEFALYHVGVGSQH